MILAHGTYLDDVLWFAIPVALSIVGLRWAERRARKRAESDESTSDATD